MVRRHLGLVACVVSLGAVGVVRAETRTVTGELVTIMCYTGHGEDGRGAKHAACALKCAKEDYPLAVLTGDGTLYKITGKLTDDHAAALQPLLAKTVVATGEIGEEGTGRTLAAETVIEKKGS